MAVLGIDIGGTSVKFAVLQETVEIIERAHCASVPGDPSAMADSIADTARALVDRYAIDGIGVACAGAVDAQGRSTADNLRWRDAPIRALLKERLHLPIVIENDGFCAMIAERQYGALSGLSHAIYLTLGTGIGGGVIADNRAIKGKDGQTPELGHMITHAGGLPCACGANGCFEAYASAGALSRMSGGQSARDVIEKARQGDADAQAIWQTYLHELATGLIGLISIFYPQAIVLGGGLSNAGSFLLEGLYSALQAIPVYRIYYADTGIALSQFQNDAGVIGAGAIARNLSLMEN